MNVDVQNPEDISLEATAQSRQITAASQVGVVTWEIWE